MVQKSICDKVCGTPIETFIHTSSFIHKNGLNWIHFLFSDSLLSYELFWCLQIPKCDEVHSVNSADVEMAKVDVII